MAKKKPEMTDSEKAELRRQAEVAHRERIAQVRRTALETGRDPDKAVKWYMGVGKYGYEVKISFISPLFVADSEDEVWEQFREQLTFSGPLAGRVRTRIKKLGTAKVYENGRHYIDPNDMGEKEK